MLSRIFWVGVAGIALIAGMALQDGPRIISWDHDEPPVHKASSIDEKVDRALDRSFDKMHVTDADGEEIDVPAKTKRAMADAVGRLVKAEADLAMARIGEDDEEAMKAASARRDKARADIDRLKAEIKEFERAAQGEDEALREEIRSEIRAEVRDSVRDAVGN
jgi:hypothetical protein